MLLLDNIALAAGCLLYIFVEAKNNLENDKLPSKKKHISPKHKQLKTKNKQHESVNQLLRSKTHISTQQAQIKDEHTRIRRLWNSIS